MSALAVVPRGTVDDVPAADRIHSLPVEFITVGANVRVNLAGLEELAASIAEQGVLQPIKVRHADDGAGYVVVWGQRRLLASRKAGLAEIPAFIDDVERSPEQLSIEQLVENLHREDLPALDRARAMRQVVDSGVTQADLARKLGIAASTVANDLGLLDSPAQIQASIEAGKLTPAHAKALKGLAPKTQVELAKQAIENGLSAHATEDLVQRHKRDEEWRQKRQDASAREAQLKIDLAVRSAERLTAKKVPLDAEIRVVGYYDKASAAAAIKKLGYTNVKTAGEISPRTSAAGCDCAAWKVEPQWNGGFSVSPGCIKPAHVAAKSRLSDHLDQARRQLSERSREALKARLLEECRGLPPMLAKVVLWRALDWSVNDWVRDHKVAGKKANALEEISSLSDEQLAADLAEYLSKRFQDQNGIKLDWSLIAAELGIETSPA